MSIVPRTLNLDHFEEQVYEYYQTKEDTPTSKAIYAGSPSFDFPPLPAGAYDQPHPDSDGQYSESTKPVQEEQPELPPENLRGGDRILPLSNSQLLYLSKIRFDKLINLQANSENPEPQNFKSVESPRPLSQIPESPKPLEPSQNSGNAPLRSVATPVNFTASPDILGNDETLSTGSRSPEIQP